MNCPPLAFLLLFFISFVFPFASHGQTETPAQIAKRLQDIQFNDPEIPDSDLPPLAQELNPKFKLGIRSAILDVVTTVSNPNPDLNTVRQGILGRLAPLSIEEPDGCAYGYLTNLRVEQPTQNTKVLAVVATVSLPCDADSSLYLFEWSNHRWRLAIAWDAGPYASIKDAVAGLSYSVSPSDSAGNWYALAASFGPWCTSCWNVVSYQVLRPSENSSRPTIVFHRDRTFYRCNDQLYRLAATPDGFAISYEGSMNYDGGLWGRPYIERYRFNSDSVTRVAPIAKLPEDFIDEWLDLPDNEALQWVIPSSQTNARSWRKKLAAIHQSPRGFMTSFDLRQRCPGMPPKWQVGLALEVPKDKPLGDLPSHIHFTVVDDGKGFQLAGVSDHRPPGCPGDDDPEFLNDRNEQDLTLPD